MSTFAAVPTPTSVSAADPTAAPARECNAKQISGQGGKAKRLRLSAAQAKMRQRYGQNQPATRESASQVATKPSATPIAQEKHFTSAQVAEMWGMSVWTVRRIFSEMPGVLKLPGESGRYKTLFIPARLLNATHEKLST